MNDPALPAAPVRARLESLRSALATHRLAAWIVPSSDPHLSEYLPARWQGREWLSGFDGSVGTLVVTAEFAGLWVDSRYWEQADAQLAGSGIATMRAAAGASRAPFDWLAAQLPAGSTVGVDGQVLSESAARDLAATLAAAGLALATARDLLDEVWPARPELPAAPVREHPAAYAPVSRREKLARLAAALAEAGADWHLISTLDDLAWLLNLRGADVPYNPVFVAHLLLERDDGALRGELFVGAGKVPAELAGRLAADGIRLAPYGDAAAALGRLRAGRTLLIDPQRVSHGLRQAVPEGVRVIEQINPTVLAKSRKTDAELACVRRAMEEDGAALAEFFAWFEQALGREPITELSIDEQVTAARARRHGYVSPSFATIAGFNAHGALPHYRATALAHARIEGDGLLLIDSGGQYLGGTTDITRVVAVGRLTPEQRADFTRVLKGMIALSRAVFPRGTRSTALDAIARVPIWADAIDYGHGTGHGVGYHLNVHEGPQSISPHAPPGPQLAMEPGMITSNEPGIYRPGRWGVRIENLLATVPAASGEFGEFLRFETLTLCPIDRRCIDRERLGAADAAWLDAYHAEVRERVAPRVHGAALDWLVAATAPL